MPPRAQRRRSGCAQRRQRRAEARLEGSTEANVEVKAEAKAKTSDLTGTGGEMRWHTTDLRAAEKRTRTTPRTCTKGRSRSGARCGTVIARTSGAGKPSMRGTNLPARQRVMKPSKEARMRDDFSHRRSGAKRGCANARVGAEVCGRPHSFQMQRLEVARSAVSVVIFRWGGRGLLGELGGL